MKRILCLALALLLCAGVLPCAAEGSLQEIRCEEEGYTTRMPANATYTYKDHTLFIWLGDYGYVPNVYIVSRVNKLSDVDNYVHSVYPNYIKDTFGDKLVATSLHEYLEVGGKRLPAASYIYKSSAGSNINLIHLVEVRPEGDIEYVARYLNGDREMTLDALDAAVRYYTPDGAAPTADAQQALAMTYVPAQANGMTLGHAFVPEGFHVSADLSICDDGASVTNPMQAVFEASSPDGTVSMAYYSRRDFVQIVDAQGPSGQLRVHQDGVFDELFLTPMLTYQKANAYSALMALMIAGDESLALAFDEDMTPYQDAVDQQARRNYAASKQQLEPLGFTLEGAESTVAQPVYTVTLDGEDYCVTVFSWISGLQFSSGMATIFGPTKETDCAWAVDACFAMLCTPDRLEQMLPVFRLFVCNTTVSEQFIQANRQLSDAIRVGTVKGRSLSSFAGEGSSYLSAETSSGDDYDSIEAYTDYIFDQNDYTLSDGTHVKVSTDYGYVYQGDNSVVYISDSALYQPGGAVQLTPNR